MNSTTKRRARATPLANGADYYARAGWPYWIPVRRDKTPRLAGFHGRTDKRPNATNLRNWQHWYGDLNIALVLQRNVVGIDVDAYPPKRGGETKARLERELGPLPSAPISTSRWPEDDVSGIRLFRVPGYYANYQDWPGKVGDGIDLICWSNRYVIVPPSIHASGRQYRWIRDGEPLREMMRPGTLEFLPDDWCEYLTGSASGSEGRFKRYHGKARSWMIRYGSGEMCPLMAEMAPKWVASLSVGNAYPAMTDAISNAVKYTAEGHTGLNAALWPLRDAYIALVGARPRSARRRDELEAVGEWRRALDGAIYKYGGRVARVDSACEGWIQL